MSRGTRYPVSALVRARELREAGWSLRMIARLIGRETGMQPAATTVALWCYPDELAERRRQMQGRANAVARASSREPLTRLSDVAKRTRMRELRERGVSFRAIGQVAAVWWGEELTGPQVESLLAGDRRTAA